MYQLFVDGIVRSVRGFESAPSCFKPSILFFRYAPGQHNSDLFSGRNLRCDFSRNRNLSVWVISPRKSAVFMLFYPEFVIPRDHARRFASDISEFPLGTVLPRSSKSNQRQIFAQKLNRI